MLQHDLSQRVQYHTKTPTKRSPKKAKEDLFKRSKGRIRNVIS